MLGRALLPWRRLQISSGDLWLESASGSVAVEVQPEKVLIGFTGVLGLECAGSKRIPGAMVALAWSNLH